MEERAIRIAEAHALPEQFRQWGKGAQLLWSAVRCDH